MSGMGVYPNNQAPNYNNNNNNPNNFSVNASVGFNG
jgi:hypothetical protein